MTQEPINSPDVRDRLAIAIFEQDVSNSKATQDLVQMNRSWKLILAVEKEDEPLPNLKRRMLNRIVDNFFMPIHGSYLLNHTPFWYNSN